MYLISKVSPIPVFPLDICPDCALSCSGTCDLTCRGGCADTCRSKIG